MESLFVECAVRAALIAVVTAVVLHTMGIKPAAARHTAWTGVMLTMLLLPTWTAWGPKAPIRLLPPVERHGSLETPPQSFFPDAVRMTEMRQVQTPVPRPTVPHWTWENLLLVAYGLGACALLARLAFGTVRTHRFRSRANVQDGKGISSECACPITVGWLHPVVILPKNWEEWPPQQLDAVLIHEREHVRRRDSLIQWVALVNRALFWFHPLSWWLERKLSVLAEEACDAAVLASGHTPQDYSEYLLDIARSVSRAGFRLDIVGMAMPGSLLRQRIRQILNSCGALPISRTRIVVAVAACATSSALLASGTLDHIQADAHLVLPIAEKRPEVVIVPPAAPAPTKPNLILAQAAPQIVPANRTPSPAPKANVPIPAEIPIATEINYFQLNRAEYSVPLTVKIPGSELALARNGGAARTTFDFVCEIKDSFGATVSNLRDKVSIDLNAATDAQLSGRPVEYDATFTLLPGQYFIKLQAQNSETGRSGTYESTFTIPNLNKEEQGIPISSVVLSSQRVELPAAAGAGRNPLVAEGRKLIPNVTRVFSRSSEMYVYLQAYQREAGNTQPLIASAAFYQGQSKVWESAPIEATPAADSRSRAVPFSLNISLSDLKPGEYTCQITVKSSSTDKTAVWQAQIAIEP